MRGLFLKKTYTVSLSIDVRITMINGVVYMLRIFKIFHRLMNNPVFVLNTGVLYIYIFICTCIYIYIYSLNTSANRIKLDLEGQYNFVNSMGSHSVRTH